MKKHIYLIDTKLLSYYLFQRGSSIGGLFDKIAQILFDFPKGEVYLGWDIGKSSYRLSVSPTYKGHRAKTNSQLTDEEQQNLAKFNENYIKLSKLAELLSINNLKVEGVECDDMCSIIAKMYENNPEYQVYLITADMDWLHSVVGTSNVAIIDVYNLPDIIDHNKVIELYGVDTRRKFTVLKSIMGDKSDNIKFCNNLGPVKAREVFDKVYSKYTDPTDEQIIQVINEYLTTKEEHRVKRNLKTSISVHQDHIDAGRTTAAEAFLANMSIADPFTDTKYLSDTQVEALKQCLGRQKPDSVSYDKILKFCMDNLDFVVQFGFRASKVFRIV